MPPPCLAGGSVTGGCQLSALPSLPKGDWDLTCDLQRLESLLILNTKIGQSLLLERLLLRLHDVGQAGISRLIQPQIRRDDHGKLRAKRLNSTVDLLCNFNRASLVLDADIAGLCRLRPAQQTRKHLTRLSLVSIDSLLSKQNQVDILLLHDALQKFGNRKGLQATLLRGLALGNIDEERTVCAHGHGGAEGVGAFGATGGEGEDVGDLHGSLALAHANGFFYGELIEGVHGVFYTGGLNARSGLVNAGFDLYGEAA